MSETSRIRRPPLDRTAPIRSWNHFVGSIAGLSPDGDGGAHVHAANRVVEEYVRAGKASAAGYRRSSPSDTTRHSAERVLQMTTDLVALWMNLLTRTAPFGVPRPDGATSSPSMAPSGAGEPEAETPSVSTGTAVTVEIDASRPVSVAITVRGSAGDRLAAQRLYPRSSDAPPLEGVSLVRTNDGGVAVRLLPPASQPPGTYDGVVYDEATSLPVGTLSVTLGLLPGAPAAGTKRRTTSGRSSRTGTRVGPRTRR